MKTKTRARHAEDKGKRREMILDAAEKVIAKRGVEGANFGAVAKQSRLSRSLIYVYFPKREDLFHAVCERGLLVLQVYLVKAVALHTTGLEQVIAMAKAYYAFSRDEPLYFSVIAEQEAYTIPPSEKGVIEQKLSDCGKQALGLVAAAIRKGIDDGSVSSTCGDPMLSAVSIWAFAHGITQVSTSKECVLKYDFGVTAVDTAEHGFRLIRQALVRRKPAKL